ncbi:helix-turn-helix transcriptional regulator [Lactobacillus amylovorus subsp. animalium]|uniref:helix-turn-helix domain-containing protein n=1 Tax=Lactobacillus amylovorus TaxID=1604 RepID=UPI0010AB55F4|nr:helix-turn-helix transcriptional regulator [Lactobacillus amylovorus]TJY06200.1 helix-turn-helix transcriptional regulator [Lactobacillus amylovorus]
MIFERIKDLAEKQHFSNLQEVAEKAGYGKNLIYSWKRKKPNSDSLKAVAKVLNTTTDYLNGLTDNPDIPSESEKRGLTWQDLDMPYGGEIPDELKGMYRALAEQYVKDHPDSLKK